MVVTAGTVDTVHSTTTSDGGGACYDNDGGDCDWSAPITFDWGCSGYYGSGTVNFYDDGSADASGAPGYWYQNTQTFDMPAGLCAAQTLTPTVIFNFNGYTTSFAWETSGNGYPSDPGCGIHDDYGYNGPNVDGTTSINMTDPSMCYEDSTTTTTTSGGGGCLLELLMTVQVTATAVQNLGSVTVLKIVKTKHLVVI